MADTDSKAKTGAEALVSTLADHGVTACFANPGTSEMHLVTALDHEPRIHSVLCLFEGVATGAADGHARVTGNPAMTLLHLGAGFLNGGANIHNAKRAWTPMINVIGDHAVPHLRYDAPLTSNILGLAGPNSVWIKSADKVADAGNLAAEAWEASFGPLPGPVSLLLPADTAWTEGGKPGARRERPKLRAPEAGRIAAAAKAVRSAVKPMILINGTALTPAGLAQAARLKAAGIRVLTDTFFPRMARGAGIFAPDRMQYFAEGAMADLAGTDLMLVAGTQVPVAFFAYPGRPSVLVPEGCATQIIGGPESDSAAILGALADALGAKTSADAAPLDLPGMPTGALNAATIGASIARHLPEGSFVSDDGVSNGLPAFMMTGRARPHEWMMLTGGAIGQGLPLALGAAIAAKGRKVLCISGDGAAMYTNQALWSMARERADVVNVIFVNNSYRILNIELARTGAGNPGRVAEDLLGLGRPEIDWVKLSEAQGVPAVNARTADEFDAALESAFATPGPHLIAAHVPAR
ncbi:acetolactate synthase large subunit [Hyphomonas sp.]|jgi:acetolactate synthase-1/2/3 large subunit|uniref:acetolactate synthase large subunit n=1 Tax=Hyphomonas sp. TaxID=87 RepID=UPI0037BE7E45